MEKNFLDWWPWPLTLTFKLDLDILSLDLHAKNQVRMFVSLAVRARQTYTEGILYIGCVCPCILPIHRIPGHVNMIFPHCSIKNSRKGFFEKQRSKSMSSDAKCDVKWLALHITILLIMIIFSYMFFLMFNILVHVLVFCFLMFWCLTKQSVYMP